MINFRAAVRTILLVDHDGPQIDMRAIAMRYRDFQ
jgi:hypothetical protein